MAKFCTKKPSKRMPASKRYKIEKKVREHNRKLRKEAKKHPKNKKKDKLVEIPNQCPFKEDILKKVEEMRKQQQEEKQKQRELAREEKRAKLAKGGLEGLVNKAEGKQANYEDMDIDPIREQIRVAVEKEENSLKAYYKEFKKVLDEADVVLEVVDARDPLGTRCKQVEEAVKAAKGNKKLVIVLNKADLVPRENLDQWLNYLRSSLPAIPFKASTQSQAKKLGNRKLGKKKENMIQNSTCFGAELLLSLLGNYCRSVGNVKTSIRVGVVGLPNVGKSSVINSLKRSRACTAGKTPGITKAMQVVQLDSKIKLLDSPGIVFANRTTDANSEDASVALKNAVRVQSLQDPFTPATMILKRISKQQMMDLYNMQEFSTPEEFFALKAAKMGKFKKGGVPDAAAAARSIIEDWNSGKIRYYTVPPEQANCHVSAEIVNTMVKEFDLANFAAEEKMVLDSIEKEVTQDLTVAPDAVDSLGPVTSLMQAEEEKVAQFKLQKKLKKLEAAKKPVVEQRKKKTDPVLELKGNQQLNKLSKLQFKKERKDRARREKATIKLADQLDGFNLSTDNYNFETDFTEK